MEGLDLAEYFITSNAKRVKNDKEEENIKVLVKKAQGEKCERCWKILPGKCERCQKASQGLTPKFFNIFYFFSRQIFQI